MKYEIKCAEPIQHCFDCGYEIPDNRYGGRCAHCAAIKYGVAEKLTGISRHELRPDIYPVES